MEIFKDLFCEDTRNNMRIIIRRFYLIKDIEYYWIFYAGFTFTDYYYFARFNSIIRPITKKGLDDSRIRFFEKDLSEECEDTIYFQENIDSHLK